MAQHSRVPHPHTWLIYCNGATSLSSPHILIVATWIEAMYLAVLQFGESGGDGCVGSRTRRYGREVITAQPVSHLDLENSRLAPTSKFVVLMEGRSGGERFIMRERVEFTMLSTPPLPPQGARHRHPTHCLSSPSPMNWNAQCQSLEIVVVLHAFGRMRCQPLAMSSGLQ